MQSGKPVGSENQSFRKAGTLQALSLISVNAMPILAVASLVPSLPLFLEHFSDVPGSGFLVPMILTIPTVCLGTLSAFAGAAADRFGRRPLLLLSLTLFVIAGVAPFFMNTLFAILIARLGVGLAEACLPTSGNALMGDYFVGDERRKWISYEMVLGPLIGSVMLLAGGFLGTISWKAPFLLYLIGIIPLVMIYIFAWEPERREAEQAEAAEGFPWRKAILVALFTFVAAVPFFSQNLQHGRIFASLGVKSSADIAIYATIASVGTMVGAYLFRKLKFRDPTTAVKLAFLLFGASFMGLAFYPPLIPGVAIDSIGQLAGGLTYTAVLAYVLGSFSEKFRGRGIGIWSSFFYIGSFMSAILLEFINRQTGDFLHALGVVGAFYFCLATLLILISIVFSSFRHKAGPVTARALTN